MSTSHWRRNIALLLLIAVFATSCGGGSDSATSTPEIDLTQPLPTAASEAAADNASADDEAGESEAQVEPTRAPEPTATAVPAPPPPTPEPTATPEPEVLFWHDAIGAGECFNRSEVPEGGLPTPIDCNGLHEEEIYASAELPIGPDEPYPGDDEMFTLADEALCAEATIEFAGANWDVLPFATYALYPLEEEWAAGDRHVMCSAAPNNEGSLKIGTAAGAGRLSDDVLLVRASLSHDAVGEFRDWLLIDQFQDSAQATSITAGEFDIPLRRPSLLAGGFMFNSRFAADEGFATSLYTYEWQGGDASNIPQAVPEFEYASSTNRGASLVFAAREAADADWNLFAISDADGAVILGDDETNEHFPAFTPDGERVVFQRNADLWITDVDGSNQIQLTDTVANEWESSVSPDGQWIAFASDRDGNDDIWLMPIDGGEAVNLTNHPGDEIWPIWSDDGTIIYFGSDRLDPENDRSAMMMLTVDGGSDGAGDVSWFSTFNAAQALVVDPNDAATARANFPTLDERYNYELIVGEPDALVEWTHSSERLRGELPAGWRVAERDGGVASFIVARQPNQADAQWDSDAVYVTLHEASTVDEFQANIFDAAGAFSSCEIVNERIFEMTSDSDFLIAQETACDDATARVLALYDEARSVGVLIEGQQDNLPDRQSDIDLLDSIARSIEFR